jgi:hypothetical protein
MSDLAIILNKIKSHKPGYNYKVTSNGQTRKLILNKEITLRVPNLDDD